MINALEIPMFTPEQARRYEIEMLKQNWRDDQTWDIENTKGFEDVRDELLEYSIKVKTEQDEAYAKKLLDFAEGKGLDGNLQLAEYLMGLEERINAATYDRNPFIGDR